MGSIGFILIFMFVALIKIVVSVQLFCLVGERMKVETVSITRTMVLLGLVEYRGFCSLKSK